MKPNFKYLIICLFALFCFNSCQDEATQETETPEESIAPNSTVANLMSLTVSNDGSVDNIMDNTDCFSVNLPVTIIVNDITIVINTLEDLELIQDIFDEYEDDEDFLDFLFPITIILNDYTEINIENEDELEDFIEECTSQDDDIIECIDFVYPISFSIYNSDFQLIDTVEINSDEALYEFLDDLEDDPNGAVIASLNYPVSLIYADGSIIEVNSNQELEAAINAAEDECEYDDDDECDLNLEDIEAYLLECGIEAYFSNDNELDELYFEFQENNILIVTGEPAVTETATWSLSETDDGYILSISELQTFAIANGDWLLEECDENDNDDWLELEFTQTENNETITMELEIDCDDEEEDCNEDDVRMYLLECYWYSGSNLMNNNENNGPFDFYNNNEVTIGDNPAGNSEGIWDIATTEDGVIIVLTLPEPYDAISGITWLVVECDEDRIEMVSGDNHLVFERDCEEDDNLFDCFENLELEFCDDTVPYNDGIMWLDLTEIYDQCEDDTIVVTYHESLADAEANVSALVSPYENTVAFSQSIYARAELIEDADIFETFEVWLNINECDPFECFGDYNLSVCDQDDGVEDGLGTFDLDLIFANCPNDDIEYYFYETLADAENQVNPLVNPYTNLVNPQAIYSRVHLAANQDVFQIYVHELIVEDCGEGNCAEQEVDATLVECIWNITNYNGSDDLSIYNFDFESNSDIVVIYTEDITIDAFWSTYQSSNGAVIVFSNVNGANIQAITGEWLVVECGDGILQLESFDSDSTMIMEQNCD